MDHLKLIYGDFFGGKKTPLEVPSSAFQAPRYEGSDHAQDSLESMLARITPQNCHSLAFEDRPHGAEAW